MKKIIFILLFICNAAFSFAGHIAGGEMFYKYIGPGAAAGTSKYQITLRFFRECNPPPSSNGAAVADLPTSVSIFIYNNTSPSTFLRSVNVSMSGGITQLRLTSPNPCITGNTDVCYQVANYVTTQDLSNTANGYIAMYQTCCRTNGIWNVQTFPLSTGSAGEGATYSCEIPGTNSLPNGSNSSAVFALKDTTLVCKSSPVRLDFSATDPDGDSLSYSFCAAHDRGGTESSADLNYSAPPFKEVTYTNGFSGAQPLGPGVTINPITGLISGIAPDVTGYYTVNVCITEWRAGKVISFHRKDFTLRITDCTLTGAELKPTYITCTGTTLTFQNESTNSNITSYLWDFGVASLLTDTSSNPTPSYDYLQSGKDSGTYTVQLKVATSTGCKDSTTATVKVYPGFKPGFTVTGSCFLNNYLFSDTSKIKYGSVVKRLWNFGDVSTLADTAKTKDTLWKYSSVGAKEVTLLVANSVGCVDTVKRTINVGDKPSLNLPFKDTLICSIDTLMLRANVSSGTVLWTPHDGPNKTRIMNVTSTNPLVYPKDTTRYYVTVNDNGCTNTDSVTVNVLQLITIKITADTTVCKTDTFRLRVTSDALRYQWTASTGESVDDIKSPLVQPSVNTKYYVFANLGKCEANDSGYIKVVNYPTSIAGNDATICYGTRVQLSGSTNGSSYSWSPAASLINPNSLTPIAGPTKTTAYVLSATDTLGCPKPKTDTVLVTVIPVVAAYAGRDTAVVAGQPLQLLATGGTNYAWTPVTGLNDPSVANPIATLDNTIDSITYTVRVSVGSCYADDQVKVRVFKTGPDIFVPNAFTPNGDGKNDVSRPILVGITKLNYFSIYNRWGQLIFTTTEENKGWDGRFNGVPQPSGAYVYQALGVDFLGKTVFKKGTVVLIR